MAPRLAPLLQLCSLKTARLWSHLDKTWGQRHSYEETGFSQPHIAWAALDAITVRIFDVGHICTKLENVDGVRIRYQIGDGYEDAGDFVTDCQSHDVQLSDSCKTVIMAILNKLVRAHELCIPRGMSIRGDELKEEWIHNRPDEKTKPASIVVAEALSATFPCK